ncbi:MAG: DUF692 family protein [Chitinophagaceae bacterium]|nr:DUF692 family protein [Oligoflexus sp.]
MTETKDTFGVGFRPQHYGWVTTHNPPEVDVFEIVSENFMGVGGRPKYFLEKLRENYPILMHGVGLSIGSQGPFDPLYLKQLKDLIQWVEPQMVSDHLSWGQLARRNSHDLLPIAYTHESMNELVGKLAYLQEFLGRRFFLENPSAYVAFEDGDYDEAGFFAELLKRSGAGILLDVNNLYVNLKNLGQNPEDFLRALRPQDVGYFHLAGHSNQGDVLVDTHDRPVPKEVWELFGKAKALFPDRPAIVEWDGNIPDFPVLLAECEKARAYRPNPNVGSVTAETIELTGVSRSNAINYSQFFEQIVRPFGIEENGTRNLKGDRPTPATTGLKVYNHAYFLRLEEVLLDYYPALAFITEEEGFRYLVAAYLEVCPPMGSSLKAAGAGLPDFLKNLLSEVDYDFGVPLLVLGDLAALEWARVEAYTADINAAKLTPELIKAFSPAMWETVQFKLMPTVKRIACSFDVLPVLHAIDNEDMPSPPVESASNYIVYRNDSFALLEQALDERESRLLAAFEGGATLIDACDLLNEQVGFYDSNQITYIAGRLVEWSERGLIMR